VLFTTIPWVLFSPEPRPSLLKSAVATIVMATVLWPVTNWVRRTTERRFGPEASSWLETTSGFVFEGSVRSTDGAWHRGRFLVSDGRLSWSPPRSTTTAWYSELSQVSFVGVRSPRSAEWWSVNPNCFVVEVVGSLGPADLAIHKHDLEELRRTVGEAHTTPAD
jgi:hypothetical protein